MYITRGVVSPGWMHREEILVDTTCIRRFERFSRLQTRISDLYSKPNKKTRLRPRINVEMAKKKLDISALRFK